MPRYSCGNKGARMRKHFVATLALVALTTMLAVTRSNVTAQVRDKTDAAFKAAMDKETVEGDLRGAIEQYKKIAQSQDRSIAAKALIRMAECYQKLGDVQARTIFEQVVRDYADQPDAVKTARARLGVTPGALNTGMTTRQVWTGREVDTYGSVSPDGRLISFTDWDTGDLALHDVTTGQNRRLTTNKKDWMSVRHWIGHLARRQAHRVRLGADCPAVSAADHFAEVR